LSANQIQISRDRAEEAIRELTGKVKDPIQGQVPEREGHLTTVAMEQ